MAFQEDTFQNNAFQTEGESPPTSGGCTGAIFMAMN